jgi:uncharacterized protein (TIGR02145 family)
MAENLNVGVRIDSAASQTNNSTIEKYCIGNKESNCTTYGGLYSWAETVQYLNGAGNTTAWSPEPTGNVQGICPAGWHLPSDTEWATLITSLGGSGLAGGEMKETGTTHWASPNTGATNNSGFTALPGGIRTATGSFIFVNTAADWWSSTQSDANNADYTFVNNNSAGATSAASDSQALGYSVRCLKDN